MARNPLQFLRRATRPSALVRALWIGVALLHAWLGARRLFECESLSLLDLTTTLLCLIGASYATLRLWHVATWFDDVPRRAIASALLLVVLHWGMAAPDGELTAGASGAGGSHTTVLLVVMPALSVALGFAALATGASSDPRRRRRPHPAPIRTELPLFVPAILCGLTALERRPPPRWR